MKSDPTKDAYDPMRSLNTRLTHLTEEIMQEDVERQDPIEEVEEQNKREHWLEFS